MHLSDRLVSWQNWLSGTVSQNPDFETRFGLAFFQQSISTARNQLQTNAEIVPDELQAELNRMFTLLWIEMASAWMLNNSELNMLILDGILPDELGTESTRMSRAVSSLSLLIDESLLPEHLQTLYKHIDRCRF